MLHGYTSHRSIIGSFFTIVLILIAVSFSVMKFDTLINHRDPRVAVWEYEHYLNNEFKFNTKEYGYTFAFGMLSSNFMYDDNSSYNDADYGEL